jgi:integrase/recombinase XerD
MLENWLAAAKMDSGYLFRQVRGSHPMNQPLRPHSVARIIKERATKAKLDRDIIINLSGHSMRVGAAQDMAVAGISLPAIMLAGGWKSVEMVMRYIEHTDVQNSGMAQLYTQMMSK